MSLIQKSTKRTFDIFLSAIGLLTLWPIVLLCVIVASMDSRASGIFKQVRVGRNGVLFSVFKIRTMYSKQSEVRNTVTISNDRRVTPSGRFMRQLKLDELPQLWNVFLGQMSFVGPRPDVPGYADRLAGAQRRILTLRPGITGPATIKYSNEEQLLGSQPDPVHYNDTVIYPDKVQLNLDYLDNYSVSKDIRYILITLRLLPVPGYLSHLEVSDV